jgi:hypothetical protein
MFGLFNVLVLLIGSRHESTVLAEVRQAASSRLQSRTAPRQGVRDLQEQPALQGTPALIPVPPAAAGSSSADPVNNSDRQNGYDRPQVDLKKNRAITASLPFDRSCVMLNRLSLSLALIFSGIACIQSATAETLLMQRVQEEKGVPLPARGMSMAQVEQSFGVPATRLDPRGGDAPRHPVINRWVYDRFTVYFERDRVISAVVNRASPTEIGPKGAQSTQ